MSERSLIALSIGDSSDAAALGYGPEHLDEAAIRISRALFRDDLDVAYGGVLRPSANFTEVLTEVARSHENEREEKAVAEGTTEQAQARIVNYQSWPYYGSITTERIAETLGLCRYVKVDPPGGPAPPLPKAGFESPKTAWLTAKALTEMRNVMVTGGTAVDGDPVPPIAARVVLGGKNEGWAGMLPGIVEEAVLTMRAKIPVYVLGGFGGAARLLAQVLSGDALPPELTMDHHRANARFQMMLEGAEAVGEGAVIADAFAEVQTILTNVKPDNGLTEDENKQLLRTEDLVTVVRLLGQGLRRKKIVTASRKRV